MKECGVVTEVSQGFAYVSFNTSSCRGGCSSCSGCKAAVRAENSIGAKCGDKVSVERNSVAVVLAAFAIFIMPVILYIAAFVISKGHIAAVISEIIYILLLVSLSGRVSIDAKITEICD